MKKSGLLWYGMLTTGILVICCIILLGYMNWEAGTVEVTALSVPGAPNNIVFIADPHVRPENLEHTREVIRIINSLHPCCSPHRGGFFISQEREPLASGGME